MKDIVSEEIYGLGLCTDDDLDDTGTCECIVTYTGDVRKTDIFPIVDGPDSTVLEGMGLDSGDH